MSLFRQKAHATHESLIDFKTACSLTENSGNVIIVFASRAINSVGECYLHTVKVTSSNLVSPNKQFANPVFNKGKTIVYYEFALYDFSY